MKAHLNGDADIGRRKLPASTSAPFEPSRQLMDVQQLAELWRVPKSTLYNWVSLGRLPYVKLGRSLRFDPQELEEFLSRRKMGMAGKR